MNGHVCSGCDQTISLMGIADMFAHLSCRGRCDVHDEFAIALPIGDVVNDIASTELDIIDIWL